MSKIAERVLKLQALAEGRNDPEAVSAANKARQLMMAHALTQADVDAAQKEDDPMVRIQVIIMNLALVTPEERTSRSPRKTMDWTRKLAFAICDYLGLKGSYNDATPYFYLHGHRSDCLMAITLYGICARQIDRACKQHQADKRRTYQAAGLYWDQGESRVIGLNFCASAVDGLTRQFRELQREQAFDQPEGNALVLNRAAKVEEWTKATYSFKKGRVLAEGYGHNDAGFKTGRSLKLHADVGIEGTSTRRLGSSS